MTGHEHKMMCALAVAGLSMACGGTGGNGSAKEVRSKKAAAPPMVAAAGAESAETGAPIAAAITGIPGDPENPLVFRAPGMAGFVDPAPRMAPGIDDDYPLLAVATEHDAPLYGRNRGGWKAGLAWAGAQLAVQKTSGSGCSGGAWYKVRGGAYICSKDGFIVGTPDEIDEIRARQPDTDNPVPFKYARVMHERAPKLSRLPESKSEADELDRIVDARSSAGSLVSAWLVGDYFLALDARVEKYGRTYYRTLHGAYVREGDLKILDAPPMRGEKLSADHNLPLAFAFDATEAFCEPEGGGALTACGKVEQHARFAAGETVERDGARYVRAPKGVLVPADAVAVAETIERPSGIPSGRKWVHVDLERQTLVAYEGDRPVYATLVSSGRTGYDTPSGLFRVRRKYTTKTMRGKDDIEGYYEVQHVPWTMFYDGNFAIHGAYWHNKFGRTKSHGCTNVPPADARWLYYWAELEIPSGWHARLDREGTHFYFTGKAPASREAK